VTHQSGLAEFAPPGRAWLGKLKTVALDLLFPPHCAVCQRFGAWLCTGCLNEIETIEPPLCQVCGLPLAADRHIAICDRCQSSPLQIDGLRAYAIHGGPLRKAIHQFKYEDLRGLAALLGRLMADGWNRLAPPGLELDVVVPVPLHRSRQQQRGYNQAALLARELGACLRLPVIEDVVVRSRATTPQVDLNVQARRANVHGAFECLGQSLSGKRVLLVDDVCTSGATLEAASMALRGAGAFSVWACTLTRARPNTGTTHPLEN
jgi:ComF family protein